MPTRELVRYDTDLQDVVGVCLPVDSQGPDGHHPATQPSLSNLREAAAGNDSSFHTKGMGIDLITGGNLGRVVRKRPHHTEGIAFISNRDFIVPDNLAEWYNVGHYRLVAPPPRQVRNLPRPGHQVQSWHRYPEVSWLRSDCLLW